jgi:hypothetical protein
MRKLNLIENLARDVQYAVRVLAKNRGFTTVSVLSLALGIGVNTALFSILDAVLMKSLPVRNPQELVAIDLLNPRGEKDNVSYPLFKEIRDRRRCSREYLPHSMEHIMSIYRGMMQVEGQLLRFSSCPGNTSTFSEWAPSWGEHSLARTTPAWALTR